MHHWTDLGRAAFRALDRVHLMAYDLGREHATMAAAQHVARELVGLGVPAGRLVLGLPCYGRGRADAGLVRTYAEIVRDAGGHVDARADTTADGALYYNGPATVAAKTRWARGFGAGAHGAAGPLLL